jgi:NAD(P)-dependent dehydrogenase (short-subunit alcohol dehydrogenase family)
MSFVENLLEGKVILITGAAGGIGEIISKTFAQYGATIILLGRTISKLEKLYDQIEQAGYPQPAIYPLNLEGATPHDYEELANRLGEEFGRLDGLVHNAAMLGGLTPIEHYDVGRWYQILQVNLSAPFMLTKACIPLLKQSNASSVIFTTDSMAKQPKAYWGAYSVAKAGLENMSKMLAEELEEQGNVRFNCLDPGATKTLFRARIYPGENPQTLPLPETLMPAYLYLMSEQSKGISGERFLVKELIEKF